MHDIAQIVTKIVIIGFFAVVAILLSLRVWHADLDLRRLLSPKRVVESAVDKKLGWLPTRDSDAIYQHGEVVGRISGPFLDEVNGMIRFDEIYQSATLNLEDEFEWQKWRLRLLEALSITQLDVSAAQKGQIIKEARCKILGARKAL